MKRRMSSAATVSLDQVFVVGDGGSGCGIGGETFQKIVQLAAGEDPAELRSAWTGECARPYTIKGNSKLKVPRLRSG